MTTTTELLTGIIVDKFDVEPARLIPTATIEDIGIDSLDIFDVVFAVEEELGIKVPNDDVKIATFQDLVDLIQRIRTEQNKL
jgi:acyl carrier protein